jgi:hypothetical protein
MKLTVERIRGRVVEIEVGQPKGLGWVAVGVVKTGLGPEVGARFEASAEDPERALERLKAEIEAQLA